MWSVVPVGQSRLKTVIAVHVSLSRASVSRFFFFFFVINYIVVSGFLVGWETLGFRCVSVVVALDRSPLGLGSRRSLRFGISGFGPINAFVLDWLGVGT